MGSDNEEMSTLFSVEDIPNELCHPCLHEVINNNDNHQPEIAVNPEEQHASIKRLFDLECAAVAEIWGTTKGNETLKSATGVDRVLGLKLNADDCNEDGRETEGTWKGNVPRDTKRTKRTESNKESARRSRARKKALLIELETRACELKDVDARLEERLVELRKKCDDAVTNNRILKADNETLRVKVQMLEITTRSTTTLC